MEEAEEFASTPHVWHPRVPKHRMFDEDCITPRICLAGSIEDCFSGLTEGVMNLYPSDDYSIYPIFISSFYEGDLDLYYPSYEEVPDAELTGEIWATSPAAPKLTMLAWFDPLSLRFDNGLCTNVEIYSKPPIWSHHAWLQKFEDRSDI